MRRMDYGLLSFLFSLVGIILTGLSYFIPNSLSILIMIVFGLGIILVILSIVFFVMSLVKGEDSTIRYWGLVLIALTIIGIMISFIFMVFSSFNHP
ncbi:hypothetical protein PJ311_08160 [Bacillus sp. CLL-7-23]|uniref:DUF3902 family protein n=1 Tax=Bacillus changyiensis TaxID=3004103 RepID=A0ABT4X2Q5_9BACI|nr:hypothetical protein [Bacillus changyiensis]MDA7026583.1 hypothetical protein [Bacillus changyiensis]